LFAENWELDHKLLPLRLAAAEALHITPSSKVELLLIVKLHIKSSNQIVFSKFNSVIFSVVDFISDFERAFQAKVELDAFLELSLNHLALFEESGFQDLYHHHNERLVLHVFKIIIWINSKSVPSLFLNAFSFFSIKK
jgi:hypothetical protein